jgi:hypothetical protein
MNAALVGAGGMSAASIASPINCVISAVSERPVLALWGSKKGF